MSSFLVLNAYLHLICFDFYLVRGNFHALYHKVRSYPLEKKAQPRNAVEEMRKKVAIKCDLCAGYKDQACVQACPTGAAIRISPTKFFGSTEEILQRRSR